MNPFGQFNIRVYGLLINKQQQVLITDEYRMGMYMTKFPGGGLEYGEGTIECLKREFKEELDIDVSIKAHFYTTDYFQKALFFKDMQLISIYYLVKNTDIEKIPTTSVLNHIPEVEGAQSFRWLDIKHSSPEELTFQIDKKVLELLKATL
ncbi:NUDIX domain-containing protein [Carboxylicivirga sediminis]|uniref:NUDIX domain-containing protein n=1 Tax=Carboxylicivirga sediminis TaxID=2006564 RepID=A0A941EYZ8_9BACT|nr:NUDIX domain-containing protein [Carboxylicivirga sediminis]MBR8534243.1 NUDIX domain-containing protein [Carboxylicivirga sediminis]